MLHWQIKGQRGIIRVTDALKVINISADINAIDDWISNLKRLLFLHLYDTFQKFDEGKLNNNILRIAQQLSQNFSGPTQAVSLALCWRSWFAVKFVMQFIVQQKLGYYNH